jgi:hypothetical protein
MGEEDLENDPSTPADITCIKLNGDVIWSKV